MLQKTFGKTGARFLASLIKINVDTLMLGEKQPEYKKYYMVKGVAIIFSLIGIIVIFINWQIGLGIIGLEIIFQVYSKFSKRRTMTNFINNILTNIALDNFKEGMGKLFSHYIA